MPGPAPKPTKLKKAAGNPGKRPLNDAEPEPESGCPECPSILQGEAGLEWVRVTKLLEGMGILAKSDLAVITSYCIAWGEYCEAQQELNQNGSLVVEVGENGSLQPHPMLSIRRRAAKEMLAAAQQLGLTPAARSRIHVEKKDKPGGKLAAFLQKHN